MCVGVRNQAPCPFPQPARAETPLIVQRLATEGLTHPAASHWSLWCWKLDVIRQTAREKKTYLAAPSLKQPPLSAFGYAKRSSSLLFKALDSNKRTWWKLNILWWGSDISVFCWVALKKTGQKLINCDWMDYEWKCIFSILGFIKTRKILQKDILTHACHVSEGFRALFWILERGPLWYRPVTTK